jgi:hypothetical protein
MLRIYDSLQENFANNGLDLEAIQSSAKVGLGS